MVALVGLGGVGWISSMWYPTCVIHVLTSCMAELQDNGMPSHFVNMTFPLLQPTFNARDPHEWQLPEGTYDAYE